MSLRTRPGGFLLTTCGLVLLTLAAGPGWESAWAATPPATLNYQGVLRNASNIALTGAFDMTFRFFDASAGGNEILVDTHNAAALNAVVVTGGVFSTELGGGVVADGGGPGSYTSLAPVFRDFDSVWLEIQVSGETLLPRVRIVASAYALNAAHLEGRPASGFLDTSAAAQAKLGPLAVNAPAPGDYAFVAGGDAGGGVFFDLADSGVAIAGAGNTGVEAYGSTAGGHFLASGGSGSAWLGYGNKGIEAGGSEEGGRFFNTASPAFVLLASGPFGISASGAAAGSFSEEGNFSYAQVAGAGRGVYANGTLAGGIFQDTDQSGTAWVGYGDRGVEASGNEMGGHLYDANGSGRAYLGYGDRGIEASGNEMGAHFYDANGSGQAYLGFIGSGIEASGWGSGAYFEDSNSSGYAFVGYGDEGIRAFGDARGGLFFDTSSSVSARLADNDRGIWALGTFAGGTFSDPSEVAYWADVATPTRKIYGTGTVSFVQNHPIEKDRTIVYAAPEGDEVAVYTRGTARLVNGEARVRLGETFAFVANPDLGLTAHLTPRDKPVPLAVDSLSSEELVVRGPSGADGVAFDYLVWGLRIGFEDLPIVQPKGREAFLPAPEAIQADYGEVRGLGRFNARARHERMRAEAGLHAPQGSARAAGLADAINEGRDHAVAEGRRRAEAEREGYMTAQAERHPAVAGSHGAGVGATAALPAPAASREKPPQPPLPPAATADPAAIRQAARYTVLPVAGVVRPGDVLILDSDTPGALRVATAARHVAVAGCAAAGEAGVAIPDGHAPVGLAGVVACRADDANGPIATGDLLTTSPTPGHVMRAGDDSTGAILGKAMEPLQEGSGLLRVLIGLR